MRRRTLNVATVTLVALGATAFTFGGWAAITVDDLPSALTAGQPTTIAFTVRQHGVTPLGRLSPSVVAVGENGAVAPTAMATPSGPEGHYVATITAPKPGGWSFTIRSGFGGSDVTLLPIAAVAAGTRTSVSEPPADIGRRLFVAKGCVSCHVHGAVRAYEAMSLKVGPELTPKRYEAVYLARFLADPSIARTPGKPEMPKLGLKTTEIASLVSFLNSERHVSTR